MLTPRQQEIARLVAKGWSNKRIGAALGISPNTVRDHISDAARFVPGSDVPARRKLMLFFLNLEDDREAA